MKKLIRNMVLASLLLLAGMPARVSAQTSTTTTSTALKYSTVKSVAEATDKSSTSNEGCVYLYNVGTGEYISFGGKWGTQPMDHEVGMPLYIDSGTETLSGDDTDGTYYQIGTNTYADSSNKGYIGYIRSAIDGKRNHGQLFIDRTGKGDASYDAIVRMIFTLVGTEADPIYNISFRNLNNDVKHTDDGDWNTSASNWSSTAIDTTFYIIAQAGDNQVVKAVKDVDAESAASNPYAQWRIVTRGSFLEHFQSTNDEYQTEKANATFLVVDQNFNRKNTHQSEPFVYYYRNGNYYNSTTTSTTYRTTQASNVWKFSSSTNGSYLRVGCGDLDQENDGQETYGGYWCATISGTGKVYQDIECPLTGWYQLKLKGLCAGSSTAEAYISNANGKESRTALHNFTVYPTIDGTTYSLSYLPNDEDLVMYLDEQLNAANSAYSTETTVLLYVTGETTFQIGVEATASGTGYTLIDDVQLYYAGNALPLVLDEDWTDETLINMQVKAGETTTLFLKRTLKEEKWNSLILPVNLTAQRVKDAFGGNTKVCKLEETKNNGYDIYFKTVEYATDDYLAEHDEVESGVVKSSETLIEAGSMYIIYPTDLDKPSSDYEYTITKKDGSTTTNAEIGAINESDNGVTITGSDDNGYTITGKLYAGYYYEVPLVSLDTKVESTVESSTVVGSEIDNGIKMMGTYVAGTAIPRYSYAINASDGKWYYLTSGSDASSGIESKGFRAWICTEASAASNAPAVANLFIDDIQVTDGIERVVQDLLRQNPVGSVYSLSGQMVNADGSLEGLPKGIYVKGGKKYVVK